MCILVSCDRQSSETTRLFKSLISLVNVACVCFRALISLLKFCTVIFISDNCFFFLAKSSTSSSLILSPEENPWLMFSIFSVMPVCSATFCFFCSNNDLLASSFALSNSSLAFICTLNGPGF